MLNTKHLTNHTFRSFRFIAIASLFVALAGLLIAPSPAFADDCGPSATPYACGTARVEVFDASTGAHIYNAKVVAFNPASGESVVLTSAVDDGTYTAQLRPGEWKIYVSASGYSDAEVPIMLEPAETEDVDVALANTRDVPSRTASQW